MVNPATVLDVRDRDRARVAEGFEDAAIQVDLDDAWVLLQGSVRDATAAPEDRVRLVLARMVLRALASPEGRVVRQESETRGPVTASRTYAGSDGVSGGLRVTADDVALLLAGTGAGSRAGTIITVPRYWP